jgi:hypothetical protein
VVDEALASSGPLSNVFVCSVCGETLLTISSAELEEGMTVAQLKLRLHTEVGLSRPPLLQLLVGEGVAAREMEAGSLVNYLLAVDSPAADGSSQESVCITVIEKPGMQEAWAQSGCEHLEFSDDGKTVYLDSATQPSKIISVVDPFPTTGVCRMKLCFEKVYNGHYVGVVSDLVSINEQRFSSASGKNDLPGVKMVDLGDSLLWGRTSTIDVVFRMDDGEYDILDEAGRAILGPQTLPESIHDGDQWYPAVSIYRYGNSSCSTSLISLTLEAN